MATIKSYTDLEQSKKLAEILPLESADMCFNGLVYPKEFHLPTFNKTFIKESIPCWSLAALLDILKYPSLTQNVENKWFITDWTGTYPKSEYDFDNTIDACVAMILKLHELKML